MLGIGLGSGEVGSGKKQLDAEPAAI